VSGCPKSIEDRAKARKRKGKVFVQAEKAGTPEEEFRLCR
jgi:hypothetical protein